MSSFDLGLNVKFCRVVCNLCYHACESIVSLPLRSYGMFNNNVLEGSGLKSNGGSMIFATPFVWVLRLSDY